LPWIDGTVERISVTAAKTCRIAEKMFGTAARIGAIVVKMCGIGGKTSGIAEMID
jgi:hypothetical protein